MNVTCTCGRVHKRGEPCVCGHGTERHRVMRQPWRVAYTDPAYRKHRAERYRLVGGRCEACGVPLRGVLHPRGATWECDHNLEARRFADPRMANAVENLRCYCRACHKRKTNASRGS